jgi:sulfur-carrier protein
VPITVQIPTALRKFTAGEQSVSVTALSLPELLDQLTARFPEISRHLRDDHGTLRRFVNVYVNDEDIRFLGGPDYKFREGDVVLLVPSIAGGSGTRRKLSASPRMCSGGACPAGFWRGLATHPLTRCREHRDRDSLCIMNP